MKLLQNEDLLPGTILAHMIIHQGLLPVPLTKRCGPAKVSYTPASSSNSTVSVQRAGLTVLSGDPLVALQSLCTLHRLPDCNEDPKSFMLGESEL